LLSLENWASVQTLDGTSDMVKAIDDLDAIAPRRNMLVGVTYACCSPMADGQERVVSGKRAVRAMRSKAKRQAKRLAKRRAAARGAATGAAKGAGESVGEGEEEGAGKAGERGRVGGRFGGGDGSREGGSSFGDISEVLDTTGGEQGDGRGGEGGDGGGGRRGG
jgi:hypothetical protein